MIFRIDDLPEPLLPISSTFFFFGFSFNTSITEFRRVTLADDSPFYNRAVENNFSVSHEGLWNG